MFNLQELEEGSKECLGNRLVRQRNPTSSISLSGLQNRYQPEIIIPLQAFARLRPVEHEFNTFCYLIDDCNLPENCRLELEEVQEQDRLVLPSLQAQYRLKPTKEFEPQVCSTWHVKTYP